MVQGGQNMRTDGMDGWTDRRTYIGTCTCKRFEYVGLVSRQNCDFVKNRYNVQCAKSRTSSKCM